MPEQVSHRQPWELVPDADVNGHETGYARVWCGDKAIVDEYLHIEDARLIAAAPDLLNELRHLVRLLEPALNNGTSQVPGLATLNAAHLAIAKAEGRA